MLISNLSNNPIKSVLDESVEVLDVLLPIGSPLSIVTTAGTTPVADNLGDDDLAGLTRIVGGYRTVKVAFQQYIQYERWRFCCSWLWIIIRCRIAVACRISIIC